MKKSPRAHRVLAALAGAVLGLTALAGPALAGNNPGGGPGGNPGGNHGGNHGGEPDCVSAEQARWLHEFDGKAGTASIELDRKRTHGKALCAPQEFALASYATTTATATFSGRSHSGRSNPTRAATALTIVSAGRCSRYSPKHSLPR